MKKLQNRSWRQRFHNNNKGSPLMGVFVCWSIVSRSKAHAITNGFSEKVRTHSGSTMVSTATIIELFEKASILINDDGVEWTCPLGSDREGWYSCGDPFNERWLGDPYSIEESKFCPRGDEEENKTDHMWKPISKPFDPSHFVTSFFRHWNR